jgi:hypothetical protein
MAKHTAPQESAPTLEAAKRLFPLSREQVLAGFPEREGYSVVDRPIPFAAKLTPFVLWHEIDLASASQPFAPPYRGWDFNRRVDNLMTAPEYGTGFEGYGIGRYDSGQDMIREIALQGKKEIDYLKQIYPGVWKTIMKEVWDALDGKRTTGRALEIMQGIWIGNLRHWQQSIKGNRVAESFRDNTKLAVANAPQRVGFYFHPGEKVIHHVFYRPKARRGLAGVRIDRCVTDPEILLRDDQALAEGWLLMSKVGMLGHMAVRAAGQEGFPRHSVTETVRSNDGWR